MVFEFEETFDGSSDWRITAWRDFTAPTTYMGYTESEGGICGTHGGETDQTMSWGMTKVYGAGPPQ